MMLRLRAGTKHALANWRNCIQQVCCRQEPAVQSEPVDLAFLVKALGESVLLAGIVDC